MAKIHELGLLSFSLLGVASTVVSSLSLSLPLAPLSPDIYRFYFLFLFFFLWFLTVKRSSGGFFFFFLGFLTTVVVGGCGCCSGGGWSVSLSSPVVCSSGVSSFDFLTF